MIAKFNCGIFKEKDALYFIVLFCDSQSNMEEFLESQMGFSQAHWIDDFDFLKIYKQMRGSYYEYKKGLKCEVISPSLVQIHGAKFRIDFPTTKNSCLNFKEEELEMHMKKSKKKYIVFGSTKEDEYKAVYTSELSYC